MKRVLCLLLVFFCMTGMMCACVSENTPAVMPNDNTATPIPAENLPTSVSEFKIIYPKEDFSQQIYYKDLALDLRTELLSLGTAMKMSSDTLDGEGELTESKYEILIGPTNRKESKAVADGTEIRTDDYIIRFADGKIVILAGSKDSYKNAIICFTGICKDRNLFDCKFEDIAALNERFAQGNSPDGFFIDGVSLKNYRVVSSLSDDKNNKFIQKIKETTGYVLELGNSENVTEYEILIGYVDRVEVTETKSELRDLDCAVKIINGKVIITAGTNSATDGALDLFYGNFLDTEKDKKEFTSEDSMVKRYEYPIKSVKLMGFDISEYVIFTKKENDTAAVNLRKYINDATGIKLDIVTDGNPQKAIVLGNAGTRQYKELTVNLKADEYIIKSVGTRVYLGTNDEYYGDGPAVHVFIKNYLGYDIGTGKIKSDTAEIDNIDECTEINDYLMKKADDVFIAEIDAKSDALRNEILNTKTEVTYTGTAYYVSADGNDENDGLTPETAWASLERVSNAAELQKGDAVFFNRGDIFRGGLGTKKGVTYSAYGDGEKPRIYGSPFDGAKYGIWEEVAPNVYRYSEKFGKDVGLVSMNNGEYWAVKILQNFSETEPVSMITGEKFGGYTDMKEDMTFWHDLGNPKSSVRDSDVGYIYMYSAYGNPSKRFDSIEFNVNGNIVGCDDDVTIDNICVMYGGCHGIAATHGTTVQNCVVGWIGGCIQFYNDAGVPTRFGNGIEAWGSSSNFTVEHCYIYQCYDAGITHQGNAGSVMKDIKYTTNLLEYNIYNIEYFVREPSNMDDDYSKWGYMDNVVMENNIMRHAGYGWGMQRPDQRAYNIQGWTHSNRLLEESGFVIRNNIMQYSVFAHVCTDCYKDDWKPVYENNVFIQQKPTERKENSVNSLWGYADPYYWTYLRGIGQTGENSYGNGDYPSYCYDNIGIDAFAENGNVFYLVE